MQRKLLLLIEDDKDIRESVAEIADCEGFDVLSAENGAIAFERLQGHPVVPDIIISDLMMPVMDGVSFRKQQLKDPVLASVPFVLMTASPTIKSRNDLGNFTYLKKPIELMAFVKLLQELDS